VAIFGNLILEDIVQVDDMTRLIAAKSFVSKDEAAVTLLEIQPESTESFIDITGASSLNWWLDWEYATAGVKDIVVRITTDGAPETYTKQITVISVADDNLFSFDTDLKLHEASIMGWLKDGHNSFNDFHRRSQTLIMDWFRKMGYADTSGDYLTKAAVTDIENVQEWATFQTLALIFKSLSNATDDIFDSKAKDYNSMAYDRKSKIVKLDLNGDGVTDNTEGFDIGTIRLVRR